MKRNESRPSPPLLIRQIGSFYRQLYRECARIFKELEFPLEMDQIPVLLFLYYENGGSQQEICVALQRDKASVNRTVSLFVREEMTRVTHDVEDKRKTKVELTERGKSLAKKANAIITEFDANLTKVLSVEEKRQFHTLMHKLIDVKNSDHLNL